MISWIILIAFTIGIALIVVPQALSVKFKRRLRVPSTKTKRKQLLQDMYASAVAKEQNRKSNYKIARKLKTAGYPFGMQVFHYQMLRLVLPVAIAILLLFLYTVKNSMNGYSAPFPFLPFIAVVLGAYFVPPLMLSMIARRRREVIAEEIVKFSHRLIVCITDKIPLYYAVRRAGRTCKILKPYVDDLLIDWMDNPRAAINNFGEQIGINEVLPLTNTLLASWNAPQEKILNLFDAQVRNIDTMRDFQVKKKIEASPLRVTFVIMIPFAVAGILCMLPWYISFQEVIRQVF
ncbi:hypothetical protein GZH47_31540 (plasmid) [Paenibacillus rhizovicinus]|uniref:Type II secretion system F family protein n=1 Tax=Paenibacillus rhizovicinus TaxID=2704463 RepID=A0A6C0PA32_9BACL|nr:hypothetical protein [Paenibacillus rhizovicinus]QHW35434.1 hypothetical protein GZH47_31540 [Paenibacillus rhizovicinus]